MFSGTGIAMYSVVAAGKGYTTEISNGKASENGRSSQVKKINRATYTVAFLFEDKS